MSFNEFIKVLIKQYGCEKVGRVHDGIKIKSPSGKVTVIHDHKAKEIKTGTRIGILKQLGLK